MQPPLNPFGAALAGLAELSKNRNTPLSLRVSTMLKKLLIANRGEIAIRIARSAADMGIATVTVYSEDDARSLHTRAGDEAAALEGNGPAAYLDAARIIAVARNHGSDGVHPGYGFLSENAAFARACVDAGLVFVGPDSATLELFGDKARARGLAATLDIPILPGTKRGIAPEEAREFLAARGPGGAIMLKAVAGGGGRGMRVVHSAGEIETAFARCSSEALQAFGNGELYAEEFFSHARHVEVQIVGDGTGAVSHFYDRECSLQRQRQKLIEIAPARDLPDALRHNLFDAATRLGRHTRYRNLGTIEFLAAANGRFVFIEANPRLQVEHTVTEEVTGFDLVRTQIEIAAGRTLRDLHLEQQDLAPPRGTAIQMRINLETMNAAGEARPSGGTIGVYEPPSGPGVRVDGFGYGGYRTGVRFELAARETCRPHALGRARRCDPQGQPCAAGISYRGCCDEHSVPAQSLEPTKRFCGEARTRASSRIISQRFCRATAHRRPTRRPRARTPAQKSMPSIRLRFSRMARADAISLRGMRRCRTMVSLSFARRSRAPS